MGVRLARSHIEHEWKTVHGCCDACGQVAELEVIDATYAVCPACDSTNRYMVLSTSEGRVIAITGG
jgi:Zn finger protein HypA/HybF involved in hydrogenase expression